GNLVVFQLLVVDVNDADRARLVEDHADDLIAGANLHQTKTFVADNTIITRLDFVILGQGAGNTTNVERAHRQLRAGLTDRLRSDNSNGSANFDNLVGRRVD